MKRNFLQFIFLIVIGVAGCNPVFENPSLSEAEETSANLEEESAVEQETGMRMRMGPGSGMMARHHAPIPENTQGSVILLRRTRIPYNRVLNFTVPTASAVTAMGGWGMAAEGVQQGLFSQAEADTFLAVHEELDRLMAEGVVEQSGGMENMQRIVLDQLVEDGQITSDESTIFSVVHDRLLDAGLME